VFDDRVSSRDFATVTTLTETGPGTFDAAVDPRWTIGGKPNGGYLLAMLGRAASAISSHRHVIAASAHYLHSPEPGPVRITSEVLRAGRSASQLHARLLQDGRPCVDALLTVTNLDPDAKPYWDAGLPDAAAAPADSCVRLPGVSPAGLAVPIMGEVEVRIDPATLGFAGGKPSGRGELRGWIGLPGDEPFDPISLLYAVDAFPPATFEIEITGWVPTLELSVYVRALPAPGPVQVLQRAQLIDAQRVDEACFVWDSTGRLVAQSTQLAGVRLG
jgi:acyl-coenzyme A thioesterase PaaI-like protein